MRTISTPSRGRSGAWVVSTDGQLISRWAQSRSHRVDKKARTGNPGFSRSAGRKAEKLASPFHVCLDAYYDRVDSLFPGLSRRMAARRLGCRIKSKWFWHNHYLCRHFSVRDLFSVCTLSATAEPIVSFCAQYSFMPGVQ